MTSLQQEFSDVINQSVESVYEWTFAREWSAEQWIALNNFANDVTRPFELSKQHLFVTCCASTLCDGHRTQLRNVTIIECGGPVSGSHRWFCSENLLGVINLKYIWDSLMVLHDVLYVCQNVQCIWVHWMCTCISTRTYIWYINMYTGMVNVFGHRFSFN